MGGAFSTTNGTLRDTPLIKNKYKGEKYERVHPSKNSAVFYDYNRYLFMPKKRPETGTLSPAFLHKNRNSDSAGVKYPRVRNNRVFK